MRGRYPTKSAYVLQVGQTGVLLEQAGLSKLPLGNRPLGLALGLKSGNCARIQITRGHQDGFEQSLEFSLTGMGAWVSISSYDMVKISVLSLQGTSEQVQAVFTPAEPAGSGSYPLPVAFTAGVRAYPPTGAVMFALTNADAAMVWRASDGTGNQTVTVNYTGAGMVGQVLGDSVLPSVNNTGVWLIGA